MFGVFFGGVPWVFFHGHFFPLPLQPITCHKIVGWNALYTIYVSTQWLRFQCFINKSMENKKIDKKVDIRDEWLLKVNIFVWNLMKTTIKYTVNNKYVRQFSHLWSLVSTTFQLWTLLSTIMLYWCMICVCKCVRIFIHRQWFLLLSWFASLFLSHVS